ncbi:MAG TPA: hypothetical protein VHF26_18660, partial [Trebonia sp.]|nr:hypothetical protein [Trebonia sp.]
IGPVRHSPSTVVVLAGRPSEPVLAAVGRSLNVVLVRPEDPPPRAGGAAGSRAAGLEGTAGVEAAAGVLRRAAGISAPYVLVAADPLSAVADAWQAMWRVTAAPRGSDEFELRAAEALAAWRAKRFELPDYYLVLAEESRPGGDGSPAAPGASGTADRGAGFYLGPLRSVRPSRVSVAAGSSAADQADALLSELGSLRHGPWWPPLDDILAAARGFYPGALAESPAAGQASLLS